jgi:hypothetical protein
MSDQHIGHSHNHTYGMAKKTLRIAFFLTIIFSSLNSSAAFSPIHWPCSPMPAMSSPTFLRLV